MSGSPNGARKNETPSRRDQRRADTRTEILAAAWAMAREHGVGGLALRELGARVGMRAQSLYSYFASKHAILDAMFAQGASEFRACIQAPTTFTAAEPRALLAEHAARIFAFSMESTPRYQLLFQRPIPGFEPSPEAYAPAVEAYESMRTRMRDIGIVDQAALDLWTALIDGMTDQQITNEPGGDRWARLVGAAVDMWFDYVTTREPAS